MPKYTIIEKEEPDKGICCSSSGPIRSGRKDRVVIACVMLDVPIAVEPVLHYQADRVHLIHYSKNHKDDGGHLYTQFFKEAHEQLESRTDVEIVEHDAKVYDYHVMMRTLLEILNYEKARTGGFMDIYVNISSGSTEYSAAAMLVCMQNKGLTAFTVRTHEYMLPLDAVKRYMYRNGKPIGFSASVEEPEMVVTFDPDKQDAELVACLGILKDVKSRKKNVYFSDLIEELKVQGIWRYVPDNKRTRTTDEQKERMYFKRTYLEPMIKKGWVKESDVVKERWEITPEGEAIIDVYHGLE